MPIDQDKLIDFGGDVAIASSNDHVSTNLNNNNFIDSNSSLITHNLNINNNLVAASDTNVERGKFIKLYFLLNIFLIIRFLHRSILAVIKP